MKKNRLITKHFFKILVSFIVLVIFAFALIVFFSVMPHEGKDGYSKAERTVCVEAAGADYTLFSNGCGDTCTISDDEFRICSTAVIYACDCGEGQCWDGEKCIEGY